MVVCIVILFFLLETPIENSKENIILENEFKELIVAGDSALIDATTNIRSEISPSK